MRAFACRQSAARAQHVLNAFIQHVWCVPLIISSDSLDFRQNPGVLRDIFFFLLGVIARWSLLLITCALPISTRHDGHATGLIACLTLGLGVCAHLTHENPAEIGAALYLPILVRRAFALYTHDIDSVIRVPTLFLCLPLRQIYDVPEKLKQAFSSVLRARGARSGMPSTSYDTSKFSYSADRENVDRVAVCVRALHSPCKRHHACLWLPVWMN